MEYQFHAYVNRRTEALGAVLGRPRPAESDFKLGEYFMNVSSLLSMMKGVETMLLNFYLKKQVHGIQINLSNDCTTKMGAIANVLMTYVGLSAFHFATIYTSDFVRSEMMLCDECRKEIMPNGGFAKANALKKRKR